MEKGYSGGSLPLLGLTPGGLGLVASRTGAKEWEAKTLQAVQQQQNLRR